MARGVAGTPARVSFTVVREDPGLLVSRFVLVDAEEDVDMWTLRDGGRIDLFYQTQPLNIRAEVLGPVQSVKFDLAPDGHTRIENYPPYALYGDAGGDYAGIHFPRGTYTLRATAYRHPGARGQAGEPLEITFEVVDSGYRSPGETPGSDLSAPLMLPTDFALEAAFPNPFNPSTTLRFALPEQANVRLVVFDVLGREVERLVDGVQPAGYHEVNFDAGNLPSGTYLYRLETPTGSFTKSLLLLK